MAENFWQGETCEYCAAKLSKNTWRCTER